MPKILKKIKCWFVNLINSPKKFLETLKPEVALELEWHGSNVGRKVIYPENLSDNSVVYSFGIGMDPSFDFSIIDKYGLKVYAFDPTPGVKNWLETQAILENFEFYAWGLDVDDGLKKFYPKRVTDEFTNHSLSADRDEKDPDVVPIIVPVKKLSTIVAELGHKKIDLLKIDIEGTEIEVLPQILAMDIPIDQLHIEFHETKFYPPCETVIAIKQLRDAGYKLCAKHGRDLTFVKQVASH